MTNTNKKPMLSLFITVLIDMLGIGLIIPIFAPLIIKNEYNLLPINSTEEYRNIIYGFLTATYTIFQFFGAPILGFLADKFGRKKILLISLIGTFIGYILFALGIYYKSITMLFIARALPGFTGGNISIIYASIADISSQNNRAKNFGLIGMAFGIGFILGPFLGGILSDNSVIKWFDYSTPLWFTALFTLINIYYVVKQFPETYKPNITNQKIDWLAGITNIKKAFILKSMRTILIVIFFQAFGFAFFMQFYQVYQIHKFNTSAKEIGLLFGYIGVWLIITQGFILRVILKNILPYKILIFAIIGLSISFLIILIPSKWSLLFFVQPLIPICQGLIQPNLTSIVSSMSDKSKQGEMLGIQQSMQSLSMSIPPIIAGFIVAFDYRLPMFIASFFMFIAWLILIIFFKKSNVEKQII